MTCEWTFVFCFKTEFDRDYTWAENHVLDNVMISRECSGKWSRELIEDSFLPLHEYARNLQHHILSVVRHDPVQVRSGPCVVVLMDKRFDVRNRLDGYRNP